MLAGWITDYWRIHGQHTEGERLGRCLKPTAQSPGSGPSRRPPPAPWAQQVRRGRVSWDTEGARDTLAGQKGCGDGKCHPGRLATGKQTPPRDRKEPTGHLARPGGQAQLSGQLRAPPCHRPPGPGAEVQRGRETAGHPPGAPAGALGPRTDRGRGRLQSGPARTAARGRGHLCAAHGEVLSASPWAKAATPRGTPTARRPRRGRWKARAEVPPPSGPPGGASHPAAP